MECHCILRNVQDLLSDGKTPHESRFGVPCKGRVIPFCAMVEKHPLPGIFVGYVLYAGRIWKGDMLVADIEELEKMDASEIHAERLNAKAVLTPRNGET